MIQRSSKNRAVLPYFIFPFIFYIPALYIEEIINNLKEGVKPL